MEGSSETGWQKSDSSRGLDAWVVSSESLGLVHDNRFSISGGQSNSARHVVGGKESEWAMLPHSDHLNKAGSSEVYDDRTVEPVVCDYERSDISLRQWLDKPERSIDVLECLHIFRQIVETVNMAHSQGIVVHNIRPSCFVMSSFNQVSFIESASCSSSGSYSSDDAPNSQAMGVQFTSSSSPHGLHGHINRFSSEETPSLDDAFQRASEMSCLRPSSACEKHLSSIEEREGNDLEDSRKAGEEEDGERKKAFPLKQMLLTEVNWYTSPEEVAGDPSSFTSDVYRLGVLLFELFCTFTSAEEKLRTMSNLRHRVLPPQLLLKWPKEASFCMLLLHPQPSARPKMSELLQSEFLHEPRNNQEEREAVIKLREEIEEQELLLEFLLQIQQRKQETADKLHDIVRYLSSDIEDVLKNQKILNKKGSVFIELNKDSHPELERADRPSVNLVINEDSATLGSRKRVRPGLQIHSELEYDEHQGQVQKSELPCGSQESILSKHSRLTKNFKKLESVYFLTRCTQSKSTERQLSRCSLISSSGRGSVVITEGSSVDNLAVKKGYSEGRRGGWLDPFLDGLSKYLSFSKLKVRADLKQGDLLNYSNLVCSLGFDRDREFFATAGINRKIKIFECDMILNEDRDIHYPVTEMASRSKLSSICWNSYIKSQIASSDFEGVVQVWDATRSQVFLEMREHERRVWSVDFSVADPTTLASGSDDCAVKLWNINQGGSVGTIKTKANVCCVQFPPDTARSLAIGSADHRIYYYDLRNTRIPLCIFVGHSKTVSYVKFVDSTTLVSASTDNSLKLWDLSTCTPRVIDSPLQTFTGHMNIKNFVGLSISDGYIATGSETNEVFVYHKAFPMPVLSFDFGCTDPLSGNEVNDPTQFVSSVCWRGQSTTLVAANSSGNIKLLEMA